MRSLYWPLFQWWPWQAYSPILDLYHQTEVITTFLKWIVALMSNCQIHSYRCRGVGNLRWHPPPSILGFEPVALTNVPWFMRTWEGGIRFSCNPFSLVYYLDCKYFAETNFWRISVKKSFFFVKNLY